MSEKARQARRGKKKSITEKLAETPTYKTIG